MQHFSLIDIKRSQGIWFPVPKSAVSSVRLASRSPRRQDKHPVRQPTHLSTKQTKAQTPHRVSVTHEHPRWSPGHSASQQGRRRLSANDLRARSALGVSPKPPFTQRRAIQRAFSQGKRVADKNFVLISVPNGRNHPRLGLAIGKKAARERSIAIG